MMRLIDADALQEKCKEIAACEWNQKTSPYSWSYAIECFLDDVDLMPTVDAVPVVHGRWIPIYHTYYNRDGACQIADEFQCSRCEIHSRDKWNFCPNCGAKMDLEEKE